MGSPFLAGILFVVVGLSRVAQAKFFERDRLMVPAIIFGCIDILFGLGFLFAFNFFLSGTTVDTIVELRQISFIFPILGIFGGVVRYVFFQRKNLILAHVIIDMVILYLLDRAGIPLLYLGV